MNRCERLLSSMLQTMNCRIEEAPNDRAAVRKLEHASTDAVLAGCDPMDSEALELLAYLRRKHPEVPCVLLFNEPHPDRVREALTWGASSVLKFPLPANSLRAAMAQALGTTEPQPAPVGRIGPMSVASGAGASGGVAELPHTLGASATSNGYHHEPPPSFSTEFAGVVGEDTNLRQAVELAASIASTAPPFCSSASGAPARPSWPVPSTATAPDAIARWSR